jgi:transcription elongation GreA/GreB family factor
LSPIARALLNAKVGQQVAFATPRGLAALEVTAVTYE